MKYLMATSAIALMFAAAPATAQTSQPGTQMDSQTPMAGDNAQNTTGQNTTQGMGSQGMGSQGMGSQGTMDQTTNPNTGYQSPNSAGTMGTTGTSGTMDNNTTMGADQRRDDGPTAPDGTPAFGIEPYFGIMGGYQSFDRETNNGVRSSIYNGALVGGVLGVNIPLGPVFVGVEGHGARGFADIRWEYGVRGRGGFRMGDSGMVFASVGYTWSDALNRRGFPDRKDWMYGIGVEAGPSDIGLGGITGRSGPRFRISVETADFNSVRPMAGIIFHF